MPLAAGRPFLSFMLDWLNGHGVDEVILSCGFMSDEVRGRCSATSPTACACATWSRMTRFGTAGPVRLAFDQGVLDERLLVLNGDILSDMDLRPSSRRTSARARA